MLKAKVVELTLLAITTAAGTQTRTPGEQRGAAALQATCLSCHEMDLISQQRLGKAGWSRELDKMIRWGTELSESEREDILQYLTASFGPSATMRLQSSTAGHGQSVFNNKCLTCHEGDIVSQQRLTRTGWVREVDKMIRWGTELSDAEKEAVVNYLSESFGPQQ